MHEGNIFANNRMMYKFLLTIFLTGCFYMTKAQISPFEKNMEKSTTYQEMLDYYQILDQKYDQMQILDMGKTDIGKELNLIILSRDKLFDPVQIRKQNKGVLLINNGIHPGEPEGIDASMMLVRNLLEKNLIPKDLVICIIPVYNIDGMLNRGQSRVNQNGPEAYGFRGNYQNLDLNRDFIKGDSKNSRVFQQVFNTWQPEVFVDTHTSNGADYQYVMTLIHPQKDKLNPILSNYLAMRMLPDLYSRMKSSGFEMTPYVNSIEETPDSGITGFLEIPRYSTGYAALHNTIGFMPETHMLKPFNQRVESTYRFIEHIISIFQRDVASILENKKQADAAVKTQKLFPLQWTLDDKNFTYFRFKGYAAKYKPSDVSGLPRLYYDRNEPFEKDIRVFDKYIPSEIIEKPLAYIIPQAWQKVIDLMLLNGIEMKRLAADTEMEVEMYYIQDYKTVPIPFEGHYLHSRVKLKIQKQRLKFFEGDYLVYLNQPKNRYIVEVLEPQGVDSFFTWNFFDSVLGQKEHFSNYVFEDEAARLLTADAGLSAGLQEEKQKNPKLNDNPIAQLDWIYKRSVHYEQTHTRYPIGRIILPAKPELK